MEYVPGNARTSFISSPPVLAAPSAARDQRGMEGRCSIGRGREGNTKAAVIEERWDGGRDGGRKREGAPMLDGSVAVNCRLPAAMGSGGTPAYDPTLPPQKIRLETQGALSPAAASAVISPSPTTFSSPLAFPPRPHAPRHVVFTPSSPPRPTQVVSRA